MASGPGPVVQRELLIKALRDRRRAAGSDKQAVAEALNWPVARLIAIEGGLEPISPDELRALLRQYDCNEDETQRLIGLAEGATEPGYWEPYRAHIEDTMFLTYLQYENGAARIEQFQNHLVHGLLQTPEYARAVLRQWYPAAPGAQLSRLLELRMARQDAVRDTSQAFVLDESVLHRRIGDLAVMRGQLSALLTSIAERPQVAIQILPLTEGATFGIRGPFGLLDFAGTLEPVLHMERTPQSFTHVGTGRDVDAHRSAFGLLRQRALPPDRSARLIRDVLAGLPGPGAQPEG